MTLTWWLVGEEEGVVFFLLAVRHVHDSNAFLAGVMRLEDATPWILYFRSQLDYLLTCDWTMSVLISTVEYDSHYMLTNHAESATCVMTTGIHEYCLALSAVPSFNSFEHVSFSVSCMNIHKYHYHGRKSIFTTVILWISLSPISQLMSMMTDYHNLTMSYCIVHRVITITFTVPYVSLIKPLRCYVRVAFTH